MNSIINDEKMYLATTNDDDDDDDENVTREAYQRHKCRKSKNWQKKKENCITFS